MQDEPGQAIPVRAIAKFLKKSLKKPGYNIKSIYLSPNYQKSRKKERKFRDFNDVFEPPGETP